VWWQGNIRKNKTLANKLSTWKIIISDKNLGSLLYDITTLDLYRGELLNNHLGMPYNCLPVTREMIGRYKAILGGEQRSRGFIVPVKSICGQNTST